MGKAELKIEIDTALLALAQAAGVDFDAALAVGVRQALEAQGGERWDLNRIARSKAADPVGADVRAKAWATENAEAIREHNQFIEEHGLVADHFRKW
jgi:antitoxin CcdA